MNRKVIYIASPYTIGDPAVNVKRQIDAANELIRMGFAPYAPLLSHFQHLIHPQEYDVWMDVGLSILLKCGGVLRLDGESKGADLECKIAQENKIPVFHGIHQLWINKNKVL